MRLKKLWTSELSAATTLARRVTKKTVMEPKQKTVVRSAGLARHASLWTQAVMKSQTIGYYLEEGRLWTPCWLHGGSLPTPLQMQVLETPPSPSRSPASV